MSTASHGRRTLAGVVTLSVSVLLMLSIAGVRADASADGGYGRRREMLSLTNHDRARHDRDALGFAARLSRYAKRHSRAMAHRGYLFHSTDDQLRGALTGYRWSIGGENVGVGDSVDGLQAAFMASREHRENILRSEFDHTAIGFVRQGGSLWVTVIFYG